MKAKSIRTAFARASLGGAALLAAAAPPASAEANVERKAYFGEQHVHTSWSFDARSTC
jgi:hypothetical protein